VNVENMSAGKIGRGNVKAVAKVFVNEADHNIQVLAGFEKILKYGVVLLGRCATVATKSCTTYPLKIVREKR